MLTYDAIVLAGGHIDAQLSEYTNQDYEAFIDIHGKPMIAYVLDALVKCKRINRIAVVGPPGQIREVTERFPDPNIIVTNQGRTMASSIINGRAALKTSGMVLVIAGDVPLVNEESISNFIVKCQNQGFKDFYYPLISKEVVEEVFPRSCRTFITLRDGKFTGGNTFMVNVDKMEEAIIIAEPFINVRKSPHKLVKMMGIGFLAKYVVNLLSLSDIEVKLFQVLGVSAKAIVVKDYKLAFDIDRIDDLKVVKDYLTEHPDEQVKL